MATKSADREKPVGKAQKRPSAVDTIISTTIPAKRGKPVLWPNPCIEIEDFARIYLGYRMWSGQAKMVRLLWDNHHAAIATAQKLGKTDGAAIVMLAHAYLLPESRGIFTAPTGKQIRRGIWATCRKLWKRSGICADCRDAGVRIAPCKHSMILPGEIYDTPESGLVTPWGNDLFGITAETADAAAGYSSPSIRWLIDEASGISRTVFEAITGNTTGTGFVGMISNPIRNSGAFFDAFHRAKSEWATLQMACHESPNFTGERHVPGLQDPGGDKWALRAHGADSVYYITRHLGRFATDDARQIFPWEVVQRAVDDWPSMPSQSGSYLQIGYDVAGQKVTGDYNCLAGVRGLKCIDLQSERGISKFGGYVGYVQQFIERNRLGAEPVLLVFDAAGDEGTKAYAELLAWSRQAPWASFVKLHALRSGDRPSEFDSVARRDFHLVRDLLFAHCSDWLKRGGTIPPHEALTDQLAYPEWIVNEASQKTATPKKELRIAMQGNRSPDEMDALCLATYQGRELPRFGSDGPHKPPQPPRAPNVHEMYRRTELAMMNGQGFNPYRAGL